MLGQTFWRSAVQRWLCERVHAISFSWSQTPQGCRSAVQRWLSERGACDSVAVACNVAFALLCSVALALRSMSSGADTLARGLRPVVVLHGKRSCDTLLQVYVCIFCVAFFGFLYSSANGAPASFRWRRAPPLFRRFPSGWLGAGPLPVGPEIRRFRPVGRKARGASKSR